MPAEYVQFLSKRKNYIQFLEMAAAVLALPSFFKEIQGAELDVYCDNTGQQGALRKGFSRAWDYCVVAGVFWELVARAQCDVWIDRVPTAANCADYPTRFLARDRNGYARAMVALGVEWVEPGQLDPLWAALERLRAAETPL